MKQYVLDPDANDLPAPKYPLGLEAQTEKYGTVKIAKREYVVREQWEYTFTGEDGSWHAWCSEDGVESMFTSIEEINARLKVERETREAAQNAP